MKEYSRIIIEEYCNTHNYAKSRRLEKLVEMSYDMYAEGTELTLHVKKIKKEYLSH